MSIIVHIGKPGSFSHAAARIQFGVDHTYMGCKSFDEVFKNVSEGHAEIGIVPLENSLTGSIYENYDLFNTYPVIINAEQYLKVEHYLLCKKGDVSNEARLRQITAVYSHPKALEQCQSFFEEHPWMRPTVANDTATAAYQVASSTDMNIAAIGSLEAAHLYRLYVLAKHVEDDRYNYTRFVYITKQNSKVNGANKCSLQLEVKHEPGSLVQVLQILKKYSLNMTKIESRPIHGKPFEYQFYLDFEFDPDDKQTLDLVLDEMRTNSHRVQILGLYKSGLLNP
jgi:prephenate dehydratase